MPGAATTVEVRARPAPPRTGRGSNPSLRRKGPPAGTVPAGLSPAAWLAVAAGLAAGTAAVSAAFVLSREQRPGALPLFWAGLLLVVLPPALAVAFGRATRAELASLVLLLGASLYVVKAMHSPFRFVFADELVHGWNADRILSTGSLPAGNTALPASVHFPGLELVTAGLASTAGIGTFVAGLVVIGVARCILQLALFALFELVSGSTRVGALAAVFYSFDPESLYWSAQFSYQSLALPLALVVLVAALSRRRGHFRSDRRRARAWTVVALVTIAAVTVTHHVTSYLLAGTLLALTVVSLASDRRSWRIPWDLALAASVSAGTWLAVHATSVNPYLGDIFRSAYHSAIAILHGREPPRRLFASAVYDTPLAERIVAVVGLAAIAFLVVEGIARRRRLIRRRPLVLLCALASLAYLGSYALRFVPSAWEIANRGSELLLLGTALILALSAAHVRLRRAYRVAGIAAFAVLFGLGFASGAISGWPPPGLVAQPLEVRVGGQVIEPQGFALAAWARKTLPAGSRMIADESNGRLLLALAGERPFIGNDRRAKPVLDTPYLDDWQLSILRATGVRYVVVDRRKIAGDSILGYYFGRADRPIARVAAGIGAKFEHASWADRVFDSGDIVVYRLREVPRALGG